MIGQSVLLGGVGVALGALMIGAGASKLATPRAAVAAITSYGLPQAASRHIAMPLAALETFAGLAVAWPASRVAGGAAVLALLVLYTAAVASMLARGRAGADCGCGGLVGGVPVGAGLLLRNLALCAVALACVLLPAAPPQGAVQWIAAVALGLPGWLLISAIDLLLARERQLADD